MHSAGVVLWHDTVATEIWKPSDFCLSGTWGPRLDSNHETSRSNSLGTLCVQMEEAGYAMQPLGIMLASPVVNL